MLIILLRVVTKMKNNCFIFIILISPYCILGWNHFSANYTTKFIISATFVPHEQSKSNQQSRAQPKTSCRMYHTSLLEKKVLANASNSYDHGPSLNSCQLLTTTVFISQRKLPSNLLLCQPICIFHATVCLVLYFTGLCKNCLVTSDHKFSISYIFDVFTLSNTFPLVYG